MLTRCQPMLQYADQMPANATICQPMPQYADQMPTTMPTTMPTAMPTTMPTAPPYQSTAIDGNRRQSTAIDGNRQQTPTTAPYQLIRHKNNKEYVLSSTVLNIVLLPFHRSLRTHINLSSAVLATMRPLTPRNDTLVLS